MTLVNLGTANYAAANECIYCGSDGGTHGLGDEHILPLALGGTAVLPEASCRACEKITSYLDGVIARGAFDEFRAHIGLKRKRRKSRETRMFRSSIVRRGLIQHRDAPITEHPFLLVLPSFDPPGILCGLEPNHRFREVTMIAYQYYPDGYGETLGLQQHEVARVNLRKKFHPFAFARAIGKIAYCNAVAALGLRGFVPNNIREAIRGTYPFVPYLVGSEGHRPPPYENTDALFWVRVDIRRKGRQMPGPSEVVLVTLRLFPRSGSFNGGFPVYQVVVGTPNEATIAQMTRRPTMLNREHLGEFAARTADLTNTLSTPK